MYLCAYVSPIYTLKKFKYLYTCLDIYLYVYRYKYLCSYLSIFLNPRYPPCIYTKVFSTQVAIQSIFHVCLYYSFASTSPWGVPRNIHLSPRTGIYELQDLGKVMSAAGSSASPSPTNSLDVLPKASVATCTGSETTNGRDGHSFIFPTISL